MIFSTDRYTGKDVFRNETLFTTANGNIGLRGDSEEKSGTYHKGTYINGFYDTEPIQYGETAYGYAVNHETILNLPDPKCIELYINGCHFGTGTDTAKDGTVSACTLQLDTDTGILTRTVSWTASDGSPVQLSAKRLVPFMEQDCAAIEYSVKNTGTVPVVLKITSSIDMQAHNIEANEDPRVGAKFKSRPLIIDSTDSIRHLHQLCFTAHTRNSGLLLTGHVIHIISEDGSSQTWQMIKKPDPACSSTFMVQPHKLFRLTKYITYCHAKSSDTALNDLSSTAAQHCIEFASLGFEKAAEQQKAYLASFWETAGIHIDGDREAEQALQFNLFHLLQSAAEDGKASIAAKGLTGEGYEGHFFWDSEAYVCPVFTYTFPRITESLLDYRVSILPAAKRRAAEMNLKGALFPWRTISGEETSAYYPAGTAQYHIDADILYALNRYLTALGSKSPTLLSDTDIKRIAAETARMWLSLGFYQKNKQGRFCINEVTGPNEYTVCVNNNAYTNLMAQTCLRISCRLAGDEASDSEKGEWKKAADSMYIPFDKKLGIYPQDDSFLDKAPWDFAHTPQQNYPLLLHYHPLVIYRHQVLKQPDLVLAQFLLSGLFSRAEKTRNFLYYEPLTTGDSSLSHCIQSIMACETGDTTKAMDYFSKTVRMDIDDVNGNSRDGIHTACMAGSWMSVVYGFAGFRDYEGRWTFNPQLPAKWNRVSFTLILEGHILEVSFTKDTAVYTLHDSDGCSLPPLTIMHRNTPFMLDSTCSSSCSKTFSLKPQLRAVLFDLDGVITNTAELHFKAWTALAEKNGLRFDRTMNRQLLGISREDSLAVILKENDVIWSDDRRKAACTEKNNSYVQLLNTLSPKDILPGIESLLADLKVHGIKAGLASASKNAEKVLSQLGLTGMFTAVADAAEVQMSKPEPDIFLAAAEQTDTWYTDCIGIEDADAGIAAIKRAGMKAVGICSSSTLDNADVRIPDTSRLTVTLLEQAINS